MQINTVKQWILENEEKFARTPTVDELDSERLAVTFDGTTKKFRSLISTVADEIFVAIEHPGYDFWDGVMSFSVRPAQTKSGYFYCEECGEKELFKSELALWRARNLEPWVEWCNEKFSRTHEIRLCGGPPGERWTSGAVVASGVPHMDDGMVHTVIPIDI